MSLMNDPVLLWLAGGIAFVLFSMIVMFLLDWLAYLTDSYYRATRSKPTIWSQFKGLD